MKTKLSGKFWLALVILSLIGQVAWVVENMYFNVFIYKMFNASASDISLMVSASAIAATLTTLFIGALSDKVGKRKIFICGGYMLWGVSILSFAFIRMDILSHFFSSTVMAASASVSIVIIMDCVMTFFGSSANDACFNAWLTDCGDETNRGSIEGINSMMPLVAILVVFGSFMAFDLDKSESWIKIFVIIGAIVFLIGILSFFIIDDSHITVSGKETYFRNIVYGFRPSVIKGNKQLYLALGAFTIFGIAIQIFMPYLIIYYEKTLNLSNYVLIMAPAIIIAAVITAFYGRIYDKYHFWAAEFPSLGILILGFIFLYLFTNTILVFLGSLFMMTGYLTGMAVFGALIRDYIPKDKSGLFQGLRIFAQVFIPGIIGPAIGAYVLRNADKVQNSDGSYSFIPSSDIYLAALIVAAVLFLTLLVFYSSTVKKAKQK